VRAAGVEVNPPGDGVPGNCVPIPDDWVVGCGWVEDAAVAIRCSSF